jgi:pentatricopeptide repeat protein
MANTLQPATSTAGRFIKCSSSNNWSFNLNVTCRAYIARFNHQFYAGFKRAHFHSNSICRADIQPHINSAATHDPAAILSATSSLSNPSNAPANVSKQTSSAHPSIQPDISRLAGLDNRHLHINWAFNKFAIAADVEGLLQLLLAQAKDSLAPSITIDTAAATSKISTKKKKKSQKSVLDYTDNDWLALHPLSTYISALNSFAYYGAVEQCHYLITKLYQLSLLNPALSATIDVYNAMLTAQSIAADYEGVFTTIENIKRLKLELNKASYYMIISSFVRAGKPRALINCFSRMIRMRLPVQPLHYTEAMSYFAMTKQPTNCLYIFLELQTLGFHPTAANYAALIHAYAEIGDFLSCYRLFNDLQRTQAALEQRREEKQQLTLQIDVRTGENRAEKAQSGTSQTAHEKFQLNRVYSYIIKACIKGKNEKLAQEMFDFFNNTMSQEKLSAELYAVMITHYSALQNPAKAKEIYMKMLEKSISPNVLIELRMLQLCSVRRMEILPQFYAESVQFYEKIKQKELETRAILVKGLNYITNVTVINQLIAYNAQRQHWKELEHCYGLIFARNYSPDHITYASLVQIIVPAANFRYKHDYIANISIVEAKAAPNPTETALNRPKVKGIQLDSVYLTPENTLFDFTFISWLLNEMFLWGIMPQADVIGPILKNLKRSGLPNSAQFISQHYQQAVKGHETMDKAFISKIHHILSVELTILSKKLNIPYIPRQFLSKSSEELGYLERRVSKPVVEAPDAANERGSIPNLYEKFPVKKDKKPMKRSRALIHNLNEDWRPNTNKSKAKAGIKW